jgi:SGNH domain (fused to AT3 domains)
LRNGYSELNRAVLLGLAASQARNLKVYPTADTFCEATCRLLSAAGQPLYFDAGHLTLTGSRMLKPVFERLIADLSDFTVPSKGKP